MSDREQQQIERKFEELSEAIYRDTRMLSSAHKIVAHPAYQEVIKMGKVVIPLILKQLRDNPRVRWFTAL